LETRGYNGTKSAFADCSVGIGAHLVRAAALDERVDSLIMRLPFPAVQGSGMPSCSLLAYGLNRELLDLTVPWNRRPNSRNAVGVNGVIASFADENTVVVSQVPDQLTLLHR
jgi:hypothetical protein